MPLSKIVIVYGGELAEDVAKQIETKRPRSSSIDVSLRCASERPKTLLTSYGPETLVCFVMQTIENGGPTEEGGSCLRFFQRKTHPSNLLQSDECFRSYAVLGLGDSNLLLDRQTTTAKDCNQVAEKLDSRLEALGGTRQLELGMADERTGLGEVEPWIEGFWLSVLSD
eukprot:CAMPEP_0194228274 /NCGR_PEP_ID=MMETSP0156-20130528/43292_1 /TAXON_ID=33649 /ORGANISM="Thalassionema nitzschioides, Strain L26-B" /LENGTH=168 /DNA_ID=CAMNT_0038960785 /DNA_START=82 /DNA_END=588 /DNA_ORIENTATION=-